MPGPAGSEAVAAGISEHLFAKGRGPRSIGNQQKQRRKEKKKKKKKTGAGTGTNTRRGTALKCFYEPPSRNNIDWNWEDLWNCQNIRKIPLKIVRIAGNSLFPISWSRVSPLQSLL